MSFRPSRKQLDHATSSPLKKWESRGKKRFLVSSTNKNNKNNSNETADVESKGGYYGMRVWSWDGRESSNNVWSLEKVGFVSSIKQYPICSFIMPSWFNLKSNNFVPSYTVSWRDTSSMCPALHLIIYRQKRSNASSSSSNNTLALLQYKQKG